MASKTYVLEKPSVKTTTSTSTTYGSVGSSGQGSYTQGGTSEEEKTEAELLDSAKRKQVYINGVKVIDTQRVLVQEGSKRKWVLAGNVGGRKVISIEGQPEPEATVKGLDGLTKQQKEKIKGLTPEQQKALIRKNLSSSEKALALSAGQELVKGSSRFEALRSKRIAEEKQKLTQAETATVTLGGSNIKVEVTGTIQPLPPPRTFEEVIREEKATELRKEITAAKAAFNKNWFTEQSKLVATVAGGTAITVKETVKKPLKINLFGADFQPVIPFEENVRNLMQRKEKKKIEGLEKELLSLYPVKDVKISGGTTIPKDTTTAEAAELFKDFPKSERFTTRLVLNVIGKKTETQKAEELILKQQTKNILLEGTTVTKEAPTEAIIFEQLAEAKETAKQRGAFKDITDFTATAVTVAAGTPVLKVVSKIPVLKAVTSKPFQKVLLASYITAEGVNIGVGGYEISKGMEQQGAARIGGTLARGAGFVTSAIVTPKVIDTITEKRLSRLVKGKTPAEARDILRKEGYYNYYNPDQLPLKPEALENAPANKLFTSSVVKSGELVKYKGVAEGKQILAPPKGKDTRLQNIERNPAIEVRVKDLLGFEALGKRQQGAKGYEELIGLKPTYSKEYLIDPAKLEQPDIMMLSTIAQKQTQFFTQTTTGKELITSAAKLNIKKEMLLTSKNLQMFTEAAVYETKNPFINPSKTVIEEVGIIKGTFTGIDLGNIRSSNLRIAAQQQRLGTSKLKLGGTVYPNLPYTEKLPKFTGTIPVISESGLPLRTLYYKEGKLVKVLNFDYSEKTLIRSLRTKTPPAKTTKGGDIVTSAGDGLLTQQKYKVIEGVKLTDISKTKKTYTGFKGSKTKTKQEGMFDNDKESLFDADKDRIFEEDLKYKVRVTPTKEDITETLKGNKFDKLKEVLLGGMISTENNMGNDLIKNNKAIQDNIKDQLKSNIQKSGLDIMQDLGTKQDQVTQQRTATDVITENINLLRQITGQITGQGTIRGKPKPKTPPPDMPNLKKMFGTVAPPKPEPKQGYDVYVKRKLEKVKKGLYKSRGLLKLNKQALSKEAALGLGASLVDRYTNRSFTIKKSKQRVKQLRQDLATRWELLKQKFRASKRNPNLLVEKSGFSIDSEEEKRGIPITAARLRKLRALQKKSSLVNNLKKVKKAKAIKWF